MPKKCLLRIANHQLSTNTIRNIFLHCYSFPRPPTQCLCLRPMKNILILFVFFFFNFFSFQHFYFIFYLFLIYQRFFLIKNENTDDLPIKTSDK